MAGARQIMATYYITLNETISMSDIVTPVRTSGRFTRSFEAQINDLKYTVKSNFSEGVLADCYQKPHCEGTASGGHIVFEKPTQTHVDWLLGGVKVGRDNLPGVRPEIITMSSGINLFEIPMGSNPIAIPLSEAVTSAMITISGTSMVISTPASEWAIAVQDGFVNRLKGE